MSSSFTAGQLQLFATCSMRECAWLKVVGKARKPRDKIKHEIVRAPDISLC